MELLTRVTLSGFKSIREMDLELRPLNVLIGANGAGKSNLISFLKMLREGMRGRLQEYVAREGGASALLHHGLQPLPDTEVRLMTEDDSATACYGLRLIRAAEALFPLAETETPGPVGDELGFTVRSPHHPSHELGLPGADSPGGALVHSLLAACATYHLNDTTPDAPIRAQGYIHDNHELASDARNLAAYLYMLRETQRPYYERILGTVRMVAPFFDDFVVTPLELNPNNVLLNWRARGSDHLFGPHQLSDGTLRAMALITLLLQPEERLPAIIVIDEPELGLHPYALEVVASLLKSASMSAQIIIATQSAALVDLFEPEDIVVVDHREGASEFRRLSEDELADWLKRYSLGELWEKNVIGGRPA